MKPHDQSAAVLALALPNPDFGLVVPPAALAVTPHAVQRYRERVEGVSRPVAVRRIQHLLATAQWRSRPRPWTLVVLHPHAIYGYSVDRPDVCLLMRPQVLVMALSRRFLEQSASRGAMGSRVGMRVALGLPAHLMALPSVRMPRWTGVRAQGRGPAVLLEMNASTRTCLSRPPSRGRERDTCRDAKLRQRPVPRTARGVACEPSLQVAVSCGVSHALYTRAVAGSNPAAPTTSCPRSPRSSSAAMSG
jgi:hypothetical protein